jgi:hypothetical protein
MQRKNRSAAAEPNIRRGIISKGPIASPLPVRVMCATADALTMTSIRERDRQFGLVRVHDEHREELGRLRLAGIGADGVASPGNSVKLCPAS